MEWDPTGSRLIIHGGNSGSSALNDYSFYTPGLNAQWTSSQSSSTSRYYHACAIDSKNNLMIVYGGLCGASCLPSDTYQMFFSSNQWQQTSGGNSQASPNSFFSYKTTSDLYYIMGYNQPTCNFMFLYYSTYI